MLSVFTDQSYASPPASVRGNVISSTRDRQPFMRIVGFLLGALKTSLSGGASPGVAKFEKLLAALEIEGPVCRELSERLIWLGEARNVIVHRHGVVDEKTANQCAWVAVKPGAKLVINNATFSAARAAVRGYVATIGLRLEALELAPANNGWADIVAANCRKLKAAKDEW